MDLLKLPIERAEPSPIINPREIFNSLALRRSIQNIWEPRAEALNERLTVVNLIVYRRRGAPWNIYSGQCSVGVSQSLLVG